SVEHEAQGYACSTIYATRFILFDAVHSSQCRLTRGGAASRSVGTWFLPAMLQLYRGAAIQESVPVGATCCASPRKRERWDVRPRPAAIGAAETAAPTD